MRGREREGKEGGKERERENKDEIQLHANKFEKVV